MTLKEYVATYTSKKAGAPLPTTWVDEVMRIVGGGNSRTSADARNVTRDAVKAQRKKIFKRLGVQTGHELVVAMLTDAVRSVHK